MTNMEKERKLDLCKILGGCEGVKLYSPLFGDVILESVAEHIFQYEILVYVASNPKDKECFMADGRYVSMYEDTECMLFPSKEQRDWSKFVRPIKEGEPMMASHSGNKWHLAYYGYAEGNVHYIYDGSCDGCFYCSKYVIPFAKFNPNDIEGSIRDYNIQKL